MNLCNNLITAIMIIYAKLSAVEVSTLDNAWSFSLVLSKNYWNEHQFYSQLWKLLTSLQELFGRHFWPPCWIQPLKWCWRHFFKFCSWLKVFTFHGLLWSFLLQFYNSIWVQSRWVSCNFTEFLQLIIILDSVHLSETNIVSRGEDI